MMKAKRKVEARNISLIGYAPGDVAKAIGQFDKQIALVDAAILQEKQSFERLYYRQSAQVEQLQALLEEALATEAELMSRRSPS